MRALIDASGLPLEETMLKTFLAGTTALAIAGGAYAYAQQSGTVGAGGEFQRVRHAHTSTVARCGRVPASAPCPYERRGHQRLWRCGPLRAARPPQADGRAGEAVAAG